jgi:hypothetical protein
LAIGAERLANLGLTFSFISVNDFLVNQSLSEAQVPARQDDRIENVEDYRRLGRTVVLQRAE